MTATAHSVDAPSDDRAQFGDVVPLVERVLADSLGGPVRLGHVERISEEERRNQLLRCHLADAPAGAPATVMVKRRRPSDYNPDDHESWATRGLLRDWAGLQFLTELGSEVVGSPRFYGGDRAAGFVVMEDLGRPQNLADLLLEGNAAEAQRGLILIATTLGTMHAATVGREAQYRRIRGALGPGDGPEARTRAADDIRNAGKRVAEQCGALGVEAGDGFGRDVETVAAAIADPGPFLAYTHGDPCPDNNAIVRTPGGDLFRLIDYEIGGYRHALGDGVYGRIRFPTCWCVRDLPEAVVQRMESAYRAALASGCPEAGDDAVYGRATVEACGTWLLNTLGWSLPRALDYDSVWGVATHRQRILMRLAAFADLARRARHLEALGDVASRLHGALHPRWEPFTLPISLYPAFSRESAPPRERVEALERAIDAGDVAAARALLRETARLANAQSAESGALPVLTRAVKRNDARMVALLLEHGADWRLTPRDGAATLNVAAESASPEVVRLLLDHGARTDARAPSGLLPLHVALGAGRADVVQLLLSRGAVPDVLAAVYLDRLDEVQRLLQEDPKRAQFRFGDDETLLHKVARHGDAARYVPLLVEHGADPDATRWPGLTPLHVAARHGHVEVVRALLAHGARPDLRTRDGETPLMLAEAGGHAEAAVLLREHGPGAAVEQ